MGPIAITVGLILGCLAIAAQGLVPSYSYWSDEIWSVAASKAGWPELFRVWLIPDTHPPLYQGLLKLWIGVAGSGETATRSLSLLMTALSLVAAAWFASGRGQGRRLVTLAFLGTSPFFLFLAQETRSYALAMALATVMVGSALRLRSRALPSAIAPPPETERGGALAWVFRGSCLLLSLTHYFALLFVLSLLAVGTAEGLIVSRRRHILPLLLAILVWPLLHGLAGPYSARLQRLDWIDVEPVTGTLSALSSGLLPLLELKQGGLALLGWVAFAIGLCWAIGSASGLRRWLLTPPLALPLAQGEARFLALVIISFTALMLVIDLIQPLSQPRYYSVLLPAAAYLCGDGWELSRSLGRFRRSALAVLLATVLLLQLRIAQQRLADKRRPLENYRAVAAFVERSDLCRQGCRSSGWRPDALMATYFRPGQLQDIGQRTAPAPGAGSQPLLVFHSGQQGLAKLRAAQPSLACWEAPGAWPLSAVVLLPPGSPSQPERHGLHPCPP